MFHDRYDAAGRLAEALAKYQRDANAIILAIPRGALQIGEVLHEKLGLPLDIIVTKKIPHPMSEEYAIGAVGPDGEYFVTLAALDVAPEYIEAKKEQLRAAVEERYVRYRGKRPKPDLRGKTVIIVDDGIATGSTMLAAIHVIRKKRPERIIVAVPVGARDSVAKVSSEADETICLLTPDSFFAIGQFYEDFTQVEDGEAIAILEKCRKRPEAS